MATPPFTEKQREVLDKSRELAMKLSAILASDANEVLQSELAPQIAAGGFEKLSVASTAARNLAAEILQQVAPGGDVQQNHGE